MSTKNIFHNALRSALENDEWKITHDPLRIKTEDIELSIDLGAEKSLGDEKLGQKIAVEIKSFLVPSPLSEFYLALGQALTYQATLRKEQPERILYLAIAWDTYRDFFARKLIQDIISEHQIRLLIFDPVKQEVALWKA